MKGGTTFSIFLCFVIFLFVNGFPTGTEVAEPAITAQNATTSEGTKRTCACESQSSNESPVCANNGVTYPGTCQFNCAKARVSRLRVVQQGQCPQTAGTQIYYQKKGVKG